MGRKRSWSAHQKQMMFFTIFFIVLAIAIFTGVLLMLNRTSVAAR